MSSLREQLESSRPLVEPGCVQHLVRHVGKRLDTVLGNPAAQPTETRVLSRFAEDVFPDAVVLLDVDRVKPSLGDPGYLRDGVVDPDHAHRPAGAL